MIGKLARRLGFQPSVPVALIDDWVIPESTKLPVQLAPRGAAAGCWVDEFARVQLPQASWVVEVALAAGARWVPVSQADRVGQRLLAPGVLETTIDTPAGRVLHRVAAGVVDGAPVAVVEIENTGGVAIAVAIVVRPLKIDSRGAIARIDVDSERIVVDGDSGVRFTTSPRTVTARSGADGDLLQSIPDPGQSQSVASASCRSAGAQAAAVWPLPHTAQLRLVVELDQRTSADAAVPTTADVNRGWASHLSRGLRVDVDGLDESEALAIGARTLLTSWPESSGGASSGVASAVVALSETGFGRDAGRLFDDLARVEDDRVLVLALARWAELTDRTESHQHDLERILGPLARAAHGVAARGGSIGGPRWLPSALIALGGRLHDIDQPDVADRVQGFTSTLVSIDDPASELAGLTKTRDARGVWLERQMFSAARQVIALRALLVDDAAGDLRLLPEIPPRWRGRTIDVLGLPIAHGSLSFGLRWHGSRPALLWEATRAGEAPVRLSVPGIDSSFASNELEGEALLGDPGWSTS